MFKNFILVLRSIYIYIYIKRFNGVTPQWRGSTPIWHHMLVNKNLEPAICYLILSYWPIKSTPKLIGYCWYSGLCPRTWWSESIADSKRTQRNQADANLEAPSLLVNFHGAGRCSAWHQRRKMIICLTQLWNLANFKYNRLHKTCPQTQ